MPSMEDPHADSVLLATKFVVPSHVTAVDRRRLVDRLDHERFPLTLVSAPAGFGKSVLVSQWIGRVADASVWISLDDRDNDLAVFLAHFVEGVQRVVPNALVGLSEAGDITESPAPATLVRMLLNDLSELDEPLVIVFDDYHVISSDAIHDVMTRLLEHPSAQLRLVLATRSDPPLPLALMRGRGQLCELRAADLAFVDDEARAFFDSYPEVDLDDDSLRRVLDETEGWPAGLRLTVEAARHRTGEPGPIRGASPLDFAYVRDYLGAEVLERQPVGIQQALLVASILDRFSASLYDAVVADGDRGELADGPAASGREFVDWLVKADLFVVALDRDGVWYRFHHLFQDLLRHEFDKRSSTVDESRIHRQASAWCVEHGLFDDAIGHAAKIGDDFETTRNLVAGWGYQLIEEERWRALFGWLALLPREMVDNDLDLLRLEAWALGTGKNQFDHMMTTIDRAEALIEADPPSPDVANRTMGCIEAMRGVSAWLTGQEDQGVERLRRADELLPVDEPRNLAWAVLVLIFALYSSGDRRGAHDLIEQARRDPRFGSGRWSPSETADVYISWFELDLPALKRHAIASCESGVRVNSVAIEGNARYYLGLVEYEQGRIEHAAQHFTKLVDAPTKFRTNELIHGTVQLALCHVAGGAMHEAQRLADDASLYASEVETADFVPLVDAFQAELALRQGNVGRAAAWADRFDPFPMIRAPIRYDPVVTLVKVLLAEGSDISLERADHVLTSYLDFAEQGHMNPSIVRYNGLQALLLATRGDDERAAECLTRAVCISQPGGAVRLLADLGPDLVPLLSRLEVHGSQLAHVAAIIAAIGGMGGESSASGDGEVGGRIDIGAGQVLTQRESDVLRLLALRYSNKEIARELLVSAATVKKHTVSLYQKLHVSSRREAVEKATALGYLHE